METITVKVEGEEVLAVKTNVEEAEDGTVGVFVLPCRSRPSGAFRVVKADEIDEGTDVAVDPYPPSGAASSETPEGAEVGAGGVVVSRDS